MQTVKLKSVKMKAFRSFVDEQETPLLPDTGLYLIKGINKDSGGSSNSGKSNLALAIAYALDCSPIPGTLLQSWLTKDKMQVSVSFLQGDKNITCNRGSVTSLEVGDMEHNGAKAYKENLPTVFGLSTEQIAALSYRHQKDGSSFLSMSDDDKKSFLAKLLKLDEIESEVERARDELKKERVRLEVALQNPFLKMSPPVCPEVPSKTDLSFNKSMLNFNQRVIDEKNSKLLAIKKRIDELNSQVLLLKKDIEKTVESLTEDTNKEIKALQASLLTLPQLYGNQKKDVQKLLTAQQKLVSKLNAEVDALERSMWKTGESITSNKMKISSHADIKDKLKYKLETSEKCDACNQTVIKNEQWQENIKNKITIEEEFCKQSERQVEHFILLKEQQAVEMQQLRKSILVESGHVDFYNKQLQSLSEKAIEAKAEIEKQIGLKRLDISTMLNRITDQHKDVLTPMINEISVLQNEGSFLKAEIANEQQKRVQIQSTIDKAEIENSYKEKEFLTKMDWYESQVKQIEAANKELSDAEKMVNIKTEYVTMLGPDGFLGNIFDEVLIDIGHRASDMLKQVPNVSRVTISFESDKKAKTTDNVTKQITPVIYKESLPLPLTGTLSGGMLAVVGLAVDLALQQVIQERTGVSLGWMILDEAMEGLGAIEKEACMELLRQVAHDKLILIVDHDDKAKDFVDGSITIESENEHSTILASIT